MHTRRSQQIDDTAYQSSPHKNRGRRSTEKMHSNNATHLLLTRDHFHISGERLAEHHTESGGEFHCPLVRTWPEAAALSGPGGGYSVRKMPAVGRSPKGARHIPCKNGLLLDYQNPHFAHFIFKNSSHPIDRYIHLIPCCVKVCQSNKTKQLLSSSAAIKFLAYFLRSLSNPYVYEIQSSAILLKHLPCPTQNKRASRFPETLPNPCRVSLLFLEVCLEGVQLISEFLRELIAKLLVEFFDALRFFRPLVVLDFQDRLQRIDANVKAFKIDILCLRHITDRGFNCVCLAFAAVDNPLEDAEVVAKTRPNEVAFVVETEPVDIEDLRSLIAEFSPISIQCWK